MNVCIDVSAAVHERAGLGRYAASLTNALIPLLPSGSLSVFYNDPGRSRLPTEWQSLPRYTWPFSNKPWRTRALLSQLGGPALDGTMRSVDVFHATDHLLPRLRHARSVFTLHDVAYHRYPQYHLPLNRTFLRLAMPRFLARADAVIAVSEATRQDALTLYRLPPEKICVIPEGVEPRFRRIEEPALLEEVRQKYALPHRFILCVSTIEPRKNLGILVDAYRDLLATHPDVGLVFVGGKGWLYGGFFEHLRRSGLEARIRLTGYIPDSDLPAVLSAAEVFAYPSIFEGFGLPPLEAMACGAPVAVSSASSLPEVVGEAGLLLPPEDAGAWARALSRLIEDPALRAELSQRGQARAARFTWEAAARKTLSVYEGVGLRLMRDT